MRVKHTRYKQNLIIEDFELIEWWFVKDPVCKEAVLNFETVEDES
jgi:hypothetical protein